MAVGPRSLNPLEKSLSKGKRELVWDVKLTNEEANRRRGSMLEEDAGRIVDRGSLRGLGRLKSQRGERDEGLGGKRTIQINSNKKGDPYLLCRGLQGSEG